MNLGRAAASSAASRLAAVDVGHSSAASGDIAASSHDRDKKARQHSRPAEAAAKQVLSTRRQALTPGRQVCHVHLQPGAAKVVACMSRKPSALPLSQAADTTGDQRCTRTLVARSCPTRAKKERYWRRRPGGQGPSSTARRSRRRPKGRGKGASPSRRGADRGDSCGMAEGGSKTHAPLGCRVPIHASNCCPLTPDISSPPIFANKRLLPCPPLLWQAAARRGRGPAASRRRLPAPRAAPWS